MKALFSPEEVTFSSSFTVLVIGDTLRRFLECRKISRTRPRLKIANSRASDPGPPSCCWPAGLSVAVIVWVTLFMRLKKYLRKSDLEKAKLNLLPPHVPRPGSEHETFWCRSDTVCGPPCQGRTQSFEKHKFLSVLLFSQTADRCIL